MRTTLDLDEALMKNLVRLSGAKTKTEAIEKAAAEFIRRQQRDDLIANRGKIKIKNVSAALRRLELHES